MKVTLWGTRGSLASPGWETARYGGNTSCVEVSSSDGTVLVLDAGTGIRRLGAALKGNVRRVDVLLTHLHMDHLQGLGFFAPLHDSGVEVHLWGPAGTTLSLRERLMRYLSPPLFPVRLRDLDCCLHLHEVPCGEIEIGPFRVSASHVCHPGATVAYRIEENGPAMAYFPDHEPALASPGFSHDAEWTSGGSIASDVDLLIHDAQYSLEEYPQHVGWGHSSIDHALGFARVARARHLVLFHHDPAHADDELDRLFSDAEARLKPAFQVTGGREGASFALG